MGMNARLLGVAALLCVSPQARRMRNHFLAAHKALRWHQQRRTGGGVQRNGYLDQRLLRRNSLEWGWLMLQCEVFVSRVELHVPQRYGNQVYTNCSQD